MRSTLRLQHPKQKNGRQCRPQGPKRSAVCLRPVSLAVGLAWPRGSRHSPFHSRRRTAGRGIVVGRASAGEGVLQSLSPSGVGLFGPTLSARPRVSALGAVRRVRGVLIPPRATLSARRGKGGGGGRWRVCGCGGVYGGAAQCRGDVFLIGANLIAADRKPQRYRGWFLGGGGCAGQYLGWPSTSERN